jgi:hypothetical protein
MQLQDEYFAAYRSLKLTRDADGVLVVEFPSKGGPVRFTADGAAGRCALRRDPDTYEGSFYSQRSDVDIPRTYQSPS